MAENTGGDPVPGIDFEMMRQMAAFPAKFPEKKPEVWKRKCRSCKDEFEVRHNERLCPSCADQRRFAKETRKRTRREEKNEDSASRKAKKKRANKRKRKNRRK